MNMTEYCYTLSLAAEVEARQALGCLQDLVTFYGSDYVYEPKDISDFNEYGVYGNVTGCRYVYNNTPDCIIANVMVTLDWATIDELKSVEGRSPLYGKPPFSRRYGSTCDILQAAQAAQDRGKSWGQCLDIAWQLAENKFGLQRN